MNEPRDPRPGQRFAPDEPPPSSTTPTAPRPPEAFASDLPSQALILDTAPVEPLLEPSLGRPRKRRWGLLMLLGGTLGLGTLEAGATLYAASLGGDWLASAWSLLLLLALTLGGAALGRELWRLRRLRRHDRLRKRLSRFPSATRHEADTTADALRRALELDSDHPHWQAYLAARQPHHGAAELYPLLDHHLLAPRDRAARRLVSRMSGETAVMVAVSPLTLVDMALVAWRSLAMVDRLCRLYGLELGYAARLRLLREVLRQMAFAGATEMAGDAGMEMLSMNLAERLSTRAAQGLGVGLTSARLGLRTQRLTRPLPFEEDQAPRLVDLRRELWQQLRRLETDGERHST